MARRNKINQTFSTWVIPFSRINSLLAFMGFVDSKKTKE